MYVRHFFKMLFGLILMGLIGIGGLVLANHYSKTQASEEPGTVSVSAN